MLQELRVKNYALLDNVEVSFSEHFTALTGETGAGKSLLVGALGLLLGQKASGEFIRAGYDEAEVSGVVKLATQSEAESWLLARDIPLEDNILVLRRLVKANGRSPIYANSVPMTREDLAELSAMLFDMHGQHEHQSLYVKENQRILLDSAAGLDDVVVQFAHNYSAWKEKREELEALKVAKAEALQEQEHLIFATEEIAEVRPTLLEKEQLLIKSKRLEGSERLVQSLEKFWQVMRGNSGVIAQVKVAQSMLKPIAQEAGEVLMARFESVMLELEDTSETLLRLRDGLDFSVTELEEMSARLSAIQRLEKKYGAGSIEGLLLFEERALQKLATLDESENEERVLNKQIAQMEKALFSQARELSLRRQACSAALEAEVSTLLADLNMPNAQFSVRIKERRNAQGQKVISINGVDDVEFMFSANQGEALRPLKMVASGGEASRILLVLKTVLAKQQGVECLIFDEIDTGVGGEAAVKIAQHLRRLALNKQVICITHLASIASCADLQLKIEKQSVGQRTSTQVYAIEGEDRVREIARMLSGTMDESALSHARSLL
jgi:DNA repair protein RecN (Recombination protein N)